MIVEDARNKWISLAATVVTNGVIFTAMSLAGMSGENLKLGEKTIEMVDVDLSDIDWDLVGIPKLGVQRDEHQLPRIVSAPTQPQEVAPITEEDITAKPSVDEGPEDPNAKDLQAVPTAPDDSEVNLARTKAQADEEESVRKAEEAKKAKAAAEKAKKEEERKRKAAEKAERQKRMMAAIGTVADPRADVEDAPIGVPNGSAYGTSTDPNAMSNQSAYISLVSLQLQRQLKVPSVLSPEERKKLQVEVQFFLDANGKVKGTPKVTKSSGNRFLDDAALSAVRRFGPDSDLAMALPSQAGLKKWVLKEGIRAIVKAR